MMAKGKDSFLEFNDFLFVLRQLELFNDLYGHFLVGFLLNPTVNRGEIASSDLLHNLELVIDTVLFKLF